MFTSLSVKSSFYLWNRKKRTFLESLNEHLKYTVKPVYNGHPWDPKKVAVVQSWPVSTGFSIKIGIKSSLAGLRLAVIQRWPLTQV
jgi:hypothetical protein